MEQQTKQEYIDWLLGDETTWRDIKDEAEKYNVAKLSDKTWDEMVPLIADAKFAAPVLTEEEDHDFLDAELVEDEEETAIEPTIQPEEPTKEPKEVVESAIEEPLYFDYVRQGVVLQCQHCGYQVQTGLGGEKICPVSEPKCPRPSPNEVN